jgi:GT2 family glycosyltransferase
VKTLAVIVLNWNGLDDTRALLQTLAHCHTPEGWRVRVLVVDNGSTDGSVEALAREFPDVALLPLPDNRRFAGGNNAGLRQVLAQGADAAMLLNNDTEADPQLLERLVLALEQDPHAGAAAPLIFFARPLDRIWYAGGRCSVALGHTSHRGLRARYTGQYRAIEPTGYLTGCCLIATRAAWEKVGLLDERYFIYAEDADWSLRARAAGFRLLFVPTARLWHKVSASAGQGSPWKIYQRVRANWTLFARHARGFARVSWLVCFGAQQKAFALVMLARGRFAVAGAVYRALWDALWGKPAGEGRA